MIERQVDLATPDGTMTTFLFHPQSGGPHPVVLYLMDAPSIRPALRDMASRLATAGYYVHAAVPVLPRQRRTASSVRPTRTCTPARELMGTVTPTNIVGDAEAMLAPSPRTTTPPRTDPSASWGSA